MNRIAGNRRYRKLALGTVAMACVSSVLSLGAVESGAFGQTDAGCDLSDEAQLSIEELPEGSDAVDCNAIGVLVVADGVGLTVPEPGMIAGTSSVSTDGQEADFQIAVSADGTVTYPELPGGSEDQSGALSSGPNPSDPARCQDTTHNQNDLKAYSTYDWYVGDAPLPGGLSQADAKTAFSSAISTITTSGNNCGLGDVVNVGNRSLGSTDSEAGFDSTGNCTSPDNANVWDAGTLPDKVVARACWWATESIPGSPNPLKEADVRYNTTLYNFTNSGGSTGCSNQYDIRAVRTHEAGHVFGLGHTGRPGHSHLTMYNDVYVCNTTSRNLGRGDVMGLDAIY